MSKKNVDDLRGVIFCCHGKACTRADARTIEKALRVEAREQGPKGSIKFIRTDCTGLCKQAPVVIVCPNAPGETQEGTASTCGANWHLEVEAEQAPALLARHFGAQANQALEKPREEKESKKAKKKKRK